MDLSGYITNILEATSSIDYGRKGFATKGKAEEGRISYEEGIALAMSTFQEANTTADPQTIILAEYTFIVQELHFYGKSDKDTLIKKVIPRLCRGFVTYCRRKHGIIF